MTPPSSSHISVYCPCPGPIARGRWSGAARAPRARPAPDTSSCPMWDTSKTPQALADRAVLGRGRSSSRAACPSPRTRPSALRAPRGDRGARCAPERPPSGLTVPRAGPARTPVSRRRAAHFRKSGISSASSGISKPLRSDCSSASGRAARPGVAGARGAARGLALALAAAEARLGASDDCALGPVEAGGDDRDAQRGRRAASSMTAPKITLQSSWAAWRMIPAASSISNRPRSGRR